MHALVVRWTGSARLLTIPAAVTARLRAAGREVGMTTAEYAVGTVAACGFGGVLYKLLTSEAMGTLLSDLLRRALTVSF